jgi:hypothetical protein
MLPRPAAHLIHEPVCALGPMRLPVVMRHFEHTPRVDRPLPDLCFTTPDSLPATQGQRQPDPPHPPDKPYRAIFLRYSWGLYKHDTLNRIL